MACPRRRPSRSLTSTRWLCEKQTGQHWHGSHTIGLSMIRPPPSSSSSRSLSSNARKSGHMSRSQQDESSRPCSMGVPGFAPPSLSIVPSALPTFGGSRSGSKCGVFTVQKMRDSVMPIVAAPTLSRWRRKSRSCTSRSGWPSYSTTPFPLRVDCKLDSSILCLLLLESTGCSFLARSCLSSLSAGALAIANVRRPLRPGLRPGLTLPSLMKRRAHLKQFITKNACNFRCCTRGTRERGGRRLQRGGWGDEYNHSLRNLFTVSGAPPLPRRR